MSLLSLFAPTATDREYCGQLISGMTVRNADDSSERLKNLVNGSAEITRKDVIPILPKILMFMDTRNLDSAVHVVTGLSGVEREIFRESDLKDIMMFLLRRPSAQTALFVVPFLMICEKSLIDGREIADDVSELVPLASFANDPAATPFIVKIARLIPELRVPFVFAGLIEQILPTITTNRDHLSLIASLVADTQSRQYFLDMGHVPRLREVLFELGVSDLVTAAFRSLLDPSDLLHLNDIQDQLFVRDFPKQIAASVTFSEASDETVRNAALCLGDVIQYHPMDDLPFATVALNRVIIDREATRNQILYVFESLAISNPRLFPEDDTFKGITDPRTVLHLSYLSYDCHRRSSLVVGDYEVSGHAMSLLLAIGVQRRVVIEGSELMSQTPEDETQRQLACANCFVTGYNGVDRNVLVYHASNFFARCAGQCNPCFHGSENATDFFPQSFLVWGANMFNDVNRGRLVHASATWAITPPRETFDSGPDESHSNLILMNSKATDVMRENDEWKQRFQALETRHNAMVKGFSQMEMELIESRCQQMLDI